MIKRIRSPEVLSKIKTLFFFLGLLLFAYLIYKFKPSSILFHTKKIGFNFIIIVALGFFSISCCVMAWKLILKPSVQKVSFWKMFKIKLVGETVNTLTPLGWGSGDPVRIMMLKDQISVTNSTASVLVDRTLFNLASAVFILIGVFLSFIKFKLPLSMEIGMPIALFLILGVCFFLYIRSHQGLLAFFVDLLKKLKLKKKFSDSTLQHIAEIDTYIADFYKKEKVHFLASLGLHFFSRILGVVEIFLIAHYLAHPLSFFESYLLASMSIIINMVFVFIPGSLGVLEGAFAGVFTLFHFDPTIGGSIQIIRRARMLCTMFLGLVLSIRVKKKEVKSLIDPA